MILVAIVAIGILAGPAIAGHEASVTSYTGCLAGKDGALMRIKAGDEPSTPCSGGMVEVHFSGGDITSITAETGLQGGGVNGAVALSVAPAYRLPQGCDSGEVVKWNGTGWECATDASATYSAGTGLDLTGTTFSIESDNLVVNGESCTTGQLVTGINSTGHITCAAPPAPPAATLQVYEFYRFFQDLGGTEAVATLDLPAGKYLVSAALTLRNLDSGSHSTASCAIPNFQSEIAVAPNADASMALEAVVTHAGGVISLNCTEVEADINLFNVIIHALRVG